MKRLVLATKNPAKLARYGALLSCVQGIQLVGLGDFGVSINLDEPFLTPEENARHKATEYARILGEDVLAIDEALYVDFLPEDQQPGVHVKRINRVDDASDQQIYDYWKQKVSEANRVCRGYFTQSFCISTKCGKLFEISADRHFIFANPPTPYFTPGYPLSAFYIDLKRNKICADFTQEEILEADKDDFADVIPLFERFVRSK